MFSFCCCCVHREKLLNSIENWVIVPLNFRLVFLTHRSQDVDGVEMVFVFLLFWLFVIHVQGTGALRETFETKKKFGTIVPIFFLKVGNRSQNPVRSGHRWGTPRQKPGPVRSPVGPPPRTPGPVRSPVWTPPKKTGPCPPRVDRDRRPGSYLVSSPVLTL